MDLPVIWSLGHGPSRVLVPGSWTFPCFGSWVMDLSVFWFMGHGPSRVLVPGSWTFPCLGSWVMDLPVFWFLGHGPFRVLVHGSWTFPCFGPWVMDLPVFWFSCHGPFLFHGPRVSFLPTMYRPRLFNIGPKAAPPPPTPLFACRPKLDPHPHPPFLNFASAPVLYG